MAKYSLEELSSARDNAQRAGDQKSYAILSEAINQLSAQMAQNVAEPETTASGMLGAITRGVAPIATGAALGAAAGAPVGGIGAIPGAATGATIAGLTTLVGDPLISALNRAFETRFATPTETIQNMLNRIGVAQARSKAEQLTQAAASGAAGAAGVAGAGKTLATLAASPQLQGVGTALAAQPMQQVAGGAVAAPAAQVAGEMAREAGASPAMQSVAELGAGMVGGMAGAGAAGLRAAPTSQLPSDIAEAQARGIRVLTTDVVPPRSFASKWLQRTGERIPLAGTASTRIAQQEERAEAVRDTLRNFGTTDISPLVSASQSDKIMKDLLSQRSADLTKYTAMKGDVINRLDAAGAVPVNRTLAQIDTEIANLEALRSSAYAPAISILQDWKSAIQGQGLINLETLRKDVGNAFSTDSLASIRGTAEKALTRIYAPLREDMADFIRTNGEPRDFAKWNVANKRLSGMAKELESNALSSALNKGNMTPEAIDQLIFSQKPSEIRLLYRNLSPAGRAMVQTRILSKAAENSISRGEAASIDEINPTRFASSLNKYAKSVGVFFKDQDLKTVNGLLRSLQITRRAQESQAAPLTGEQLIPLAATEFLASIFGSFGAATMAAGTIGAAARAYESAPVRNAMVRVSQTVQGTPEEAAAVKRAMAVLQQQITKAQNADLNLSSPELDEFERQQQETE